MAPSSASTASGSDPLGVLNGNAGVASNSQGITTKAFTLNLAFGLGLFGVELLGFLILKSLNIGKRIYQPKTYLVQDRLRVDNIPANPYRWLRKIFSITGDELKAKCGLDGYFLIRFIRAMLIIFVPLMVLCLITLFPLNYTGGAGMGTYQVGTTEQHFNVTGLDTLSWQNVAPTHTDRYWGHLVCAVVVIGWVLYRIYKEKLHFIHVRQQFLSSPEHRLKASARTVLISNIPREFRSKEDLKAMYDVFVGDDRSKLQVWVNRDYSSLKKLVNQRRKLIHALEKAELKILRKVNKKNLPAGGDLEADNRLPEQPPMEATLTDDGNQTAAKTAAAQITTAFDADCQEEGALWRKYLKQSAEPKVTICEDSSGDWKPKSTMKFWSNGKNQQTVPKIAWLRSQIAQLNVQIDELAQHLDDDNMFHRQNSAFIQFDRQMSAQMAVGLVSHHLPGRMSPRFFNVAPHEVLWPNMGLTSLRRFVRGCIALVLFVGMIFLWGIPTTFLGFLSQLESLRQDTSWLSWLQSWPAWLISFISGPGATILLALLVQLVVPALCRKLAVLIGCPTRSTREVVTARFYFTFLFIELVLVTSISSGLITTLTSIFHNPSSIPTKLANNLPKAANYFFNYLIIQGLGFSGSVLVQYLRLLYITTIWPWFTQTPREEAWLQTTIPHQMWGNVYPLLTNFAVIALIYSIIAPLVLVFATLVFTLFWIAYRHNYYFVQRIKVDTYGKMFQGAMSQLLTGIYVLEIVLIGLFFLVRNSDDKASGVPQAIIMIVVLVLTAAIHYVIESYLSPLYDLLPVSLEDEAAENERRKFLLSNDSPTVPTDEKRRDGEGMEMHSTESSNAPLHQSVESLDGHVDGRMDGTTTGAQQAGANTRKTLIRMRNNIALRLTANEAHALNLQSDLPKRLEHARQLGGAIAGYPDELSDLTSEERLAELRVAYQDPVTREPAPVVWLPRDQAGLSDDAVKQVAKYGKYLQYTNEGAVLSKNNKVEITRPAPDVRVDWLLDWFL